MTDISIIIPTFKRPDMVLRAVDSAAKADTGDLSVEIIVADNDPDGGAREAVTHYAQTCARPVIYVHVPNPGVSNARNGALEKTSGRYWAFLDDDMEATHAWPAALIETLNAHKAGFGFGPIRAIFPNPDSPLNEPMREFFERHHNGPAGVISAVFGAGGCVIDRERVTLPEPVFNPELNETGGEDDALFAFLLAHHATPVWSPEALTYEHVPESRMTRDYYWTRNFRFGQGPSQSASEKAGLRPLLEVPFWMAVGLVQLIIHAPQYAWQNRRGHPQALYQMAKTSQALGKILWTDRFSPRLYGAAANPDQLSRTTP